MKLQKLLFNSIDEKGIEEDKESALLCASIVNMLQRRPDKFSAFIEAMNVGMDMKIRAVQAKENLVGLVLSGLSDKEIERLKKKCWWPTNLET